MDDLLGEQKERLPPEEPVTSSRIPTAPDSVTTIDTPPPEGAAPHHDTVACEGPVPSKDTVCPDDTDDSDDKTIDSTPVSITGPHTGTVSPPATVSLRGTVPSHDTVLSEDPGHFIRNDLDGTRVELTSNYFLMDADVFDVLSFHQDPYERIVYGYLYRQSYGFKRQTCFVGLKALVEGCQISKNSVRRTLDRLEEKGHIQVIERINERDAKGTLYRIYLPCEIHGLKSQTTFKTHH